MTQTSHHPKTSAADGLATSREIHDGLAQSFVLTSLHLERALTAAREADVPDPRLLDTLTAALEENRAGLREARRLIHVLRTAPTAVPSLPSRLEQLARRVEPFDMQFDLQIIGRPYVLPLSVAHALHRIAQEAVVNAVRHAEARAVFVHLVFGRCSVALRVVDDGVGLSPAKSSHPGVGLQGLCERGRIVGARIVIRRGDPGGTEVVAIWPLSTFASVTPA